MPAINEESRQQGMLPHHGLFGLMNSLCKSSLAISGSWLRHINDGHNSKNTNNKKNSNNDSKNDFSAAPGWSRTGPNPSHRCGVDGSETNLKNQPYAILNSEP